MVETQRIVYPPVQLSSRFTQKLFVLNSPLMSRASVALAEQMQQLEAGQQPGPLTITSTYERLYGRPPTDAEVALGLEFLGGSGDPLSADRWEQYAQVLLAANEMTFVD